MRWKRDSYRYPRLPCKKTLLVGDINSGKTFRGGEILAAFCRAGLGGRIVILDMAPEIPEAMAVAKGLRGAGGRLSPPPGCDVLVFEASPVPPVSAPGRSGGPGKGPSEPPVIEALFPRVSETSRDILFINDVSLYLQAGNAEDLISFLHRFGTVIANGYWGNRLGGGSLTDREKEQMKRLMAGFGEHGRVILPESI